MLPLECRRERREQETVVGARERNHETSDTNNHPWPPGQDLERPFEVDIDSEAVPGLQAQVNVRLSRCRFLSLGARATHQPPTNVSFSFVGPWGPWLVIGRPPLP